MSAAIMGPAVSTFFNPQFSTPFSGEATPFVYLACLVAILVVSSGIVEMARELPSAGAFLHVRDSRARPAGRVRHPRADVRRLSGPAARIGHVRHRHPDRIPVALLGEHSDESLDESLYAILARAGRPVASASAQLIPTLANAKLARQLMVKRGTPLLHIDQVDYDGRGRAVMLSHEWHVADAFDLVVNRRALPSGNDT